MDPNLEKKIEELSQKIDAVYVSSEKLRKYFKITMWVTIIVIVLPLVGLVFTIPMFLNNYVDALGGSMLGF